MKTNPLSNRGLIKGGTELSIDKISVVFDVPSIAKSENGKWWIKIEQGCKIIGGEQVPSNQLFEYAYSFPDFYLQFGSGLTDKDGKKMRLEFNPNKVVDKVSSLQSFIPFVSKYFRSAGITRIDWAIDYYHKVNPLNFYDASKRKNCVWFGKKGRGAETVYIGSRSSDVQYRIYNKKIELQEKQKEICNHENLWRLECSDKASGIFLSSKKPLFNPFKKIKYFQIPSDAKGLAFFFWDFASRYGINSAFSYLKNNDYRYLQKQLKEFDGFESPEYVFERDHIRVWNGLQTKLGVS